MSEKNTMRDKPPVDYDLRPSTFDDFLASVRGQVRREREWGFLDREDMVVVQASAMLELLTIVDRLRDQAGDNPRLPSTRWCVVHDQPAGPMAYAYCTEGSGQDDECDIRSMLLIPGPKGQATLP